MNGQPNALLQPFTQRPYRPLGRPHLRDAGLLLACVLVAAIAGHAQRTFHAPARHVWPVTTPDPYTGPYAGRYANGYANRYASGYAAPTAAAHAETFATKVATVVTHALGETAAPVPRTCLATAAPAPNGAGASGDIAADLPGLYGAPWVGTVHGQLIAALHVTVPRNAATPPPDTVLQMYLTGSAHPYFSKTVPVSVTRGPDALIYRMFVGGPIRCIDLIIPNGAGAGTAHLYYRVNGQPSQAQGVFTVQR